jgi:acylphosphatase
MTRTPDDTADASGASGDAAVRRIVRVRGRVQGVGFRMSAASEAARLGVGGTVRNLFDGTVEADVEGPADSVAAMVEWLRAGPSSAQVSGIDVRADAPRGAESFRVVG